MQGHWARLGEPSKKARKEETKSKAEQTVGHVSRRDFLKKAVPVIAGVGLAGVLGIDRVFATNPSAAQPNQGNRIEPASYIIYHGNEYYAQNGTTGALDFSGSDAATVIQSAVETLTEGGLIVLRRGVYILTATITLGHGIYLLGEQGSVLRVGDGAHSDTNPFNMIEVTGDNVTIDNLELDGNAQSNPNLAGTTLDPPPANPNMQSGILVRSGQNGEIANCYIHDIWNAGIWLAAIDGDVRGCEITSCQIQGTGKSQTDPSTTNAPQSASAVYVFRVNGSTSGSIIHDNVIIDVFGQGIYLHFDTDSIVSDNILSKTPGSSDSTAGIIIDDSAKRITIRGNQVSGYGPGIFIAWAGCEDIIVEANGCFDAPISGGSGYGVLVASSAPWGPQLKTLIVKGNICKGNALSGISVSSSETVIEGNICYNNNQDTAAAPTQRAGIIVQPAGYPLISNISINGNRCFDNQPVPTQNYGLSISQMSNQIADVLIANNDLRGNGVAAIGELDCSRSKVIGNLGYNPQGLAPIQVGASPFTYTNSDGVPEAVYITGGSVSQISKNDTPVFTSAPATIWLEPDESVTVVHSDPPQMMKDRH